METLVYIASVGYSGSTLLDMLLGMNHGVTSLGEVAILSDFYRHNYYCTCGNRVKDCDFWRSVEERLRLHMKDAGLSIVDLVDCHLSFKKSSKSIHHKMPTLAEILLVLGNKKIFDIFGKISKEINQYQSACNNIMRLYNVVSEITGSSVLIDSSKYPLQLKTLYLSMPAKVKIIFLVRDGRGNSCSLMSRKNITMMEAARIWVRYNKNLQLIMRSIPSEKVLFLKYEDLCKCPEKNMDVISKFLGLVNPLQILPIDKDKFHNIGGNPMRFRREEMKIMLDEKWRGLLLDADLEIFNRIAGKLNRKFGYE